MNFPKYQLFRLLTGFAILLPVLVLSKENILDKEITKDSLQVDSVQIIPGIQMGNGFSNGNGSVFSETGNRLPQLLRDVKVYLSEAVIADVHNDTLEVIYNLDRIFNLLTEADQFGEMTQEDLEEFNRFEVSLVDIYTHRLRSLKASDLAITAEQFRIEISEVTEPLEVEMGPSKFTVIDDRDGHIPLVRNKKVDQFIKFFQKKGHKQFEIWLERYDKYGPMLHRIIAECNLPEELVFLAMIESGFNPKAYSKANATGMWQFIYSTAKMYGLERNWYIDERRDPEKATRAACAYLTDLYNEFDNWYLALAAYNAGEGRVRRARRLHQTSDFWQMHSLPRETRNYLPYFLAATIIARNPHEFGFFIKEKKQAVLEYDEVTIEKSADLSVLAHSAEISFNTLKNLNPELRQSATPTDPYILKIPKGKMTTFLNNYNTLPENQRFAPQHTVHRVKRNESLWTISRKYGVSIHDLAAVNKIKNRNKIKMGQKLTIPIRGPKVRYTTNKKTGPNGHVKKVYTVKKGDTLGHIAENHKTLARNIRRWNGLEYGGLIYPGQKLILWIKQG